MNSINRRQFLVSTVGVAAISSTVLSKAAAADPLGLPIGIQL
jgi:hypothetical protein